MQAKAIHDDAIEYKTVQRNTIRCKSTNTKQSNAIQYTQLPDSEVDSTIHCKTMQKKHDAILDKPIQYNAGQ